MDAADPSIPLGYASPAVGTDAPPRAWPPLLTLLPMAAFFCVLFPLRRPINHLIGQGWERFTGFVWIVAVALSLVALVTLAIRRKRRTHVTCLVLHALFIAATVLPPGCVLLAWLMHWLTGPGA